MTIRGNTDHSNQYNDNTTTTAHKIIHQTRARAYTQAYTTM
jgi:hypothetical protein